MSIFYPFNTLPWIGVYGLERCNTRKAYGFYFQIRVIFALFNRLWHDYYSEANEIYKKKCEVW